MTQLNPIVPPALLNTLTVAGILEYINDRRQENNADFLDDSKMIRFVNSAINELNQENKYFFKEKMVNVSINTDTTKWYSYVTLVTNGDLKKPQELRIVDGTTVSEPLQIDYDYKIEPSATATGKGVRFISSIIGTLQILYWAYIPKITASTETIDIPHEFNNFFVEKVLQYVYEGEDRFDKADRYMMKAQETYNNLRQDNREQDTNTTGFSSHFAYQ